MARACQLQHDRPHAGLAERIERSPDLANHEQLLAGRHLKHGVRATLCCRGKAGRIVQIADHGVGRTIIQIQPNEGLDFYFVAKKPGPVLDMQEVCMDFLYADHFDLGSRTGYETLLYDVLIGDQSLFQRADQVERGWEIVQPILAAWAKDGAPEAYKAGSQGPAGADALIARDGRSWHPIS